MLIAISAYLLFAATLSCATIVLSDQMKISGRLWRLVESAWCIVAALWLLGVFK